MLSNSKFEKLFSRTVQSLDEAAPATKPSTKPDVKPDVKPGPGRRPGRPEPGKKPQPRAVMKDNKYAQAFLSARKG
jgi:hypothetical protein